MFYNLYTKKSEEIRGKNGKIRLIHRFVSIRSIYNNYHICVSYLRNNNKPELFADILNASDSDKLHAKYILMAIFTHVFLSWYKTNRNSVFVLVYGLSFATVAIASFAILLVFTYQFSEKLFISILPTSPGTFLSTEEGSNLENLCQNLSI